MSEMLHYCSIDGGNSSINIIIDGEAFRPPFTSIQSDPSSARLSYNNAVTSKGNTRSLLDKLHVETTIHLDDQRDTYISEFVFGKMAEIFSKELRSRENKEKYQDKELVKMMLTALAYALLDKKMKNEDFRIKENDNLIFNICLSTGLPYREAIDNRKRQIYSKLLEGTHRVVFKHPVFHNLTIDLVIEEAYVLVEGEYALTYELNRPGGIGVETDPQDLLNKKISIIDIGGHTTEIVTVDYKLVTDEDDQILDEYNFDLNKEIEVIQEVRADMIEGLRRGVATIMEDLIPEIREEYMEVKGKPLRELTRRDIELAFTPQGVYNGKVGHISPEHIYIADKVERQAKILAQDIVAKFHTLFQGHAISELDTIFLAGGGSRVNGISQTIKNELGVLGYNKDKILSVKDPVYANVKGYYYGLSLIKEGEGIQPIVE